MPKVYLLLRNNQQTGPFSLEELLQYDLKPYDLIWIEGKSAGWYYPQEIQALQPYLPFLKKKTTTAEANHPLPSPKSSGALQPKKVFVSLPSNATRNESPAKSSLPSTPFPINEASAIPDPLPLKEELKTTYAKSLQEVESDYMNWRFQQKAKKRPVVSKKGVAAACLVVTVVLAAWWILKPSASGPEKIPPEQTAFVSPNHLTTPAISAEEKKTENTLLPVSKKQKPNRNTNKIKKSPSDMAAGMEEKQPAVVNIPQKSIATTNDYELAPEIKEETTPAIEEKNETAATETPKKKKLKEKILDLFKKKPEEKSKEETQTGEQEGERRSVRREQGANLAQMVTVKFAIPNNWMIGIKGAKATLLNRSNEAIIKASVEVLYYNDDNEILDKKLITFSGIKSKQSQTISVPDHSTATLLEYTVLSVAGANEPFAKR